MIEYRLTTVDNPYSPFDQFDEWYSYDMVNGHDTLGFQSRIANVTDDMTEEEQEEAFDYAMNEIVRLNVLGKHKKVKQSDFK